MGLGDFSRQRQTQSRPTAFVRIERQQGLSQDDLAHARAAITHLDAVLGSARQHLDLDFFWIAAGLVRVLEEIDQRLAHLRTIEGFNCSVSGVNRSFLPSIGAPL